MSRRLNYLNNRDLLSEIHKSKNSYSSYTESEYSNYDLILSDLDRINIRTIAEAKRNRAKKLSQELYESKKSAGEKVKLTDCEIDYKKIPKTDLVFRIMTFDHIPDESGRKKNPKTIADQKTKLNFTPYQHWKFNDEDQLICVGKSHWIGGMSNGHFSKDHGKTTNKLALMWLKLVDRYATRGNVRGYCVDTATQALTKRGWVGIDTIDTSDQILSFNGESLAWSKIKSVYRGDHNGPMYHLFNKNLNSFVTPGHKIVTEQGLVDVELLNEKNHLILMSNHITDQPNQVYQDSFVELIGIIKSYCKKPADNQKISNICIKERHDNKVRNCLSNLSYDFREYKIKNKYTCFKLSPDVLSLINKIIINRNIDFNFIANLTQYQRTMFINILSRSNKPNCTYRGKTQKDVDTFQALCALSGVRATETDNYKVNKLSRSKNRIVAKHAINCKQINHQKTGVQQLKPTGTYNGRVWCPETEYGCFVARRKGTVFLTGNSYNDEMKGQAIVQLSQVGLQFDESKSNNPFAYYTQTITNSFVRIINIEKRNQNIRDDILEMNNLNPSHTRLHTGEWEAALERYNQSKDS